MEYIDLHLPSGTLWSANNIYLPNNTGTIYTQSSSYHTYDCALNVEQLPTFDQLSELIHYTSFTDDQRNNILRNKYGKLLFPKNGKYLDNEFINGSAFWCIEDYHLRVNCLMFSDNYMYPPIYSHWSKIRGCLTVRLVK